MKRLNIILDDETAKKLNSIVKNKGMTKTGAVKIALKEFYEKDPVEQEEKEEKAPKVDKKIEEELEGYAQHKWLCPMHPTQYADTCGCLETGRLKAYLTQ